MRSAHGNDARAFAVQFMASNFVFCEDCSWMTDDLYLWGGYLIPLLLFVTSAAYAVKRPVLAFLMPFAAAAVLMTVNAAFSREGLGSHLPGIPVYTALWAAYASWASFPGALVGLVVRALGGDVDEERWGQKA
jgi:hypothetical protein